MKVQFGKDFVDEASINSCDKSNLILALLVTINFNFPRREKICQFFIVARRAPSVTHLI